MDAIDKIKNLYFYMFQKRFPGYQMACYLIQERIYNLCGMGDKRTLLSLVLLAGYRFDQETKIEDICSQADDFIIDLCEKAIIFDKMTEEEKFYEIYGIPIKKGVNISKYINPSNINMSFLVKNSVMDNWPAMLRVALPYEDKWPPKPPAMFVQEHLCHRRTMQIAAILMDAEKRATKLGYIEIINILKDRISKGMLLYPCCERNDCRIQINRF